MNKIAISVEHLTKQYDLGVIGTGTLSRDLNRWWARLRKQPDPYTRIGQKDAFERIGETILALDDVSFTVQQGEALGIIGRNGAGKSTLLKILSRVTAPTSGVVKVRGRIGSLLEVGTGFHPELTGRENVYLNGAILGMKKAEVARKFDEIVAFSGVEKFIDTPVKRYSSGMYVRLAFAVAAHLDPEILIVDEVLAVGDAEFQKKCLGKMGDVAGEGRTVLFVSHNMAAIQNLCPNTILLEGGCILHKGPTELTIKKYIGSTSSSREPSHRNFIHTGTGELTFSDTWVEDEDGNKVGSIFTGQKIKLVAIFQIHADEITDPKISFAIRDSYGNYLTDLWNQGAGYSMGKLTSSGKVICTIPKFPLNEDLYSYSLHCTSRNVTIDHVNDAGSLSVERGDYFGTGKLPPSRYAKVLMEQKWEFIESDNHDL